MAIKAKQLHCDKYSLWLITVPNAVNNNNNNKRLHGGTILSFHGHGQEDPVKLSNL